MPLTEADFKERAKKYTDPIPGDKPGGTNPSGDPRHDTVKGEVDKLQSLTEQPDWKKVVDVGGEILAEKAKDLPTAAYLAYGLYHTKGLDGLALGLTVLCELMDNYWDTMFPEPKRTKPRGNALSLFMDRCIILFPNQKIVEADREIVTILGTLVGRFGKTVRSAFMGQGPAVGPFTEGIDRLYQTLPAAAPPPPPPAPTPAPAAAAPAPAAQPAPTPAPAPVAAAPAPVAAAPVAAAPAVAAPAMPTAPAAGLADAAEVTNFLRGIGGSLADAANLLRRADPSDPLAYRLIRQGIWLHIVNPPPAQGTKTQVPAPPDQVRKQIETIAQNGKWAPLLEECEALLKSRPFWLDIHRFSAQALAGLGHKQAREALITEVYGFIRRLPIVLDLTFGDGNAFADPGTKAWIESDVMPKGTGGGGDKASGPTEAEIMTEARNLLTGGKVADGIGMLQARIVGAANGQARFKSRLALAKVCLQGNLTPVARALYEGLERDVTAHKLEDWDPGLAAEALEGLLSCHKAVVKSGKPLPPDNALLYDRLCRIEPAAAARIG